MSSKSFRWLIGVLLLIIVLRAFFFTYYKVPSVSMIPAIRPGDLIIVSRLHFFSTPTLRSISSRVMKNTIYVFYKPLSIESKEYVKRCIGLPGDTVTIRKAQQDEGYHSRVDANVNLHIFPHDTSYHWSQYHFGPVIIPKKGMHLDINRMNLALYKEILQSEGFDTVSISARFKRENSFDYCFKNNYYFMLGDNFYESEDSRFFGFVPEQNFIGRVIMVL